MIKTMLAFFTGGVVAVSFATMGQFFQASWEALQGFAGDVWPLVQQHFAFLAAG